jgi:hypothetical protein
MDELVATLSDRGFPVQHSMNEADSLAKRGQPVDLLRVGISLPLVSKSHVAAALAKETLAPLTEHGIDFSGDVSLSGDLR